MIREIVIEIIDGLEYKLYENDKGFAIRLFDIDANEVYAIKQFRDSDAAKIAFCDLIILARR